MKILYSQDTKEIRNIIESKAKFQKVMVLFDDNVSNLKLTKIYESIKDLCIYNQCDVKNLDVNELYNGYRVVVYLCCANSFIKLKIFKHEFINIYCPTDNAILPYFTDNLNTEKDYLLLMGKTVDINVFTSVSFNKFFNYLKSVLSFENVDCGVYSEFVDVNYITMIELLNGVDGEFVDIDILKKEDVDYCMLNVVDLVLIDAFLVLINSVKNKQLSLVDFYKSARDNDKLIEKFYSMLNNNNFTNLINVNFNRLNNLCNHAKQQILSLVKFTCGEDLDILIKKVKNYSKESSGILSYLYLFDMFNV